jgi:hypothetical protein
MLALVSVLDYYLTIVVLLAMGVLAYLSLR